MVVEGAAAGVSSFLSEAGVCLSAGSPAVPTSLKKIRAPSNENRSSSNSFRLSLIFLIVKTAACCSSFFDLVCCT